MAGGTAVAAAGACTAALAWCELGGAGPGPLRAGEGLSLAGCARAELRGGALQLCLAACVAREGAALRVQDARVEDCSYAFLLDDAAQLHARRAAVAGVTGGMLVAGDSAARAALSVRDSRLAGAAPLWYGRHRPGWCDLEGTVLPAQRASPLQLSAGPLPPAPAARRRARPRLTRGAGQGARRARRTAGATICRPGPASARVLFDAPLPPPPLPPRAEWTRRVPPPVLIGHAASLPPY